MVGSILEDLGGLLTHEQSRMEERQEDNLCVCVWGLVNETKCWPVFGTEKEFICKLFGRLYGLAGKAESFNPDIFGSESQLLRL